MAAASAHHLPSLKAEIRAALVTRKAIAGPIGIRLAWHASGTYDPSAPAKGCPLGGSDGATMRFAPERTDPDNAGLSIVRDLLLPVAKAHPELSTADLWALAGCVAVEMMGGPVVPFGFGRTDVAVPPQGESQQQQGESSSAQAQAQAVLAKECPANGRLPDATQGAEHLRAVFGARMGFSDEAIVALSGGHTVGRCHAVRSGFDGPWTTKTLVFDNEYFVKLVEEEWVPRQWDGPKQFEDKKTRSLMMLPTDMALIEDPGFRPHVERFAKSQDAFFAAFAEAYGRLIALGCPESCQPPASASVGAGGVSVKPTIAPNEEAADDKAKASVDFREACMHGSLEAAQKCVARGADVNAIEVASGRTALHKAAFWGHNAMAKYLVAESADKPALRLDVRDYAGETALHDAARFGHEELAAILLKAGASTTIRNTDGQTPADVAAQHGYLDLASTLGATRARL